MSAGKRANGFTLLAALAMLTSAALLLAPAVALAQPPGGGPGQGAGLGRGTGHGPGHGFHGRRGFDGPGRHHPGDPLRHLLSRLDLSAEQRDAVREIVEAEREAGEPLREDLARAREGLFEASGPESFDEGAVRAAAERVAALEVEVAVARARTFSRVWTVLTPDQQAKAQAMRAGRKAFREEMHEWRRGGPEGG